MTRARATAQIVLDAAAELAAKDFRNYVIDGGCRIARGASVGLSNSAQFGKLDMFAGFAAGTVGAGTVSHTASASVGRTGRALHFSGVTLTGSGVAKARHRIEAAEAMQLKNATASFAVSVRHDLGAAVDYTIILRKADAADNFTAVTQIASSLAISVASATSTRIALEAVSMGDCSNGIEIEVQAACGAVTTKNFYFTEWQLEESATATGFRRLPYADELARVNRHYRRYTAGVTYESVPAFGGEIGSTSGYFVVFHPGMRTAPTLSGAEITGGNNAGGYVVTLGSKVIGDKDGSQYAFSMASGGSAGRVCTIQVTNVAGAHFSLDARL